MSTVYDFEMASHRTAVAFAGALLNGNARKVLAMLCPTEGSPRVDLEAAIGPLLDHYRDKEMEGLTLFGDFQQSGGNDGHATLKKNFAVVLSTGGSFLVNMSKTNRQEWKICEIRWDDGDKEYFFRVA